MMLMIEVQARRDEITLCFLAVYTTKGQPVLHMSNNNSSAFAAPITRTSQQPMVVVMMLMIEAHARRII